MKFKKIPKWIYSFICCYLLVYIFGSVQDHLIQTNQDNTYWYILFVNAGTLLAFAFLWLTLKWGADALKPKHPKAARFLHNVARLQIAASVIVIPINVVNMINAM